MFKVLPAYGVPLRQNPQKATPRKMRFFLFTALYLFHASSMIYMLLSEYFLTVLLSSLASLVSHTGLAKQTLGTAKVIHQTRNVLEHGCQKTLRNDAGTDGNIKSAASLQEKVVQGA